MSALARLFRAEGEKREAYAEYNAAGLKLKLAGINERLARLRSQVQPLDELTEDREQRTLCLKAAFWAVHGHWPDDGWLDD